MKKSELIEKINMNEVFYYYVEPGWVRELSFASDGSFGCLGSNESENPANDWVASLRLPKEEIEDYICAEGWAVGQEDETWLTDDNRILTREEMRKEALDEGDWYHIIEEIKNNIKMLEE